MDTIVEEKKNLATMKTIHVNLIKAHIYRAPSLHLSYILSKKQHKYYPVLQNCRGFC